MFVLILMYVPIHVHIYIHPKANSKLELDTENSSPQFRDLSARGRGHWGDPPALTSVPAGKLLWEHGFSHTCCPSHEHAS